MKRAEKDLLNAVLEPRKPGALQKIESACAAGADPNGICPEGSTSQGHVPPGRTLLTHAVTEGSSKAVQKLLECNADPNLEDQNGWTPWMASTLADESKRNRIQESLLQYGATRDGEHIGALARAVFAGDVQQVEPLIQSERDMKALAHFRVDLVARQIAAQNTPMLELLLKHKMPPSSTHLINAIRNSYLAGVDLLLRHGQPAEHPDEGETPLMTAAALGDLAIVQRLVEAGADVNRYADDSAEWTPSFYAQQAGKTNVADWLRSRMDEGLADQQDKIMEVRDPAFRILYEHATSGEGTSTDDIVQKLTEWNEKYGIAVTAADAASITLEFSSLPEDVESFCEEVLQFCPDASGDSDELQRELKKSMTLGLWWD